MIELKKTVFENKDIVVLNVKNGKFYQIGEVVYIDVAYGEFHEGTYSGKSEQKDDHHYTMCLGAYFPVNKLDEALEYYNIIKDYFLALDAEDPVLREFSSLRDKLKKYGYSLDEIKKMNLEYLGA